MELLETRQNPACRVYRKVKTSCKKYLQSKCYRSNQRPKQISEIGDLPCRNIQDQSFYNIILK